MRQAQNEMTFETGGSGLYEITGKVSDWLSAQGFASGVLTLFIRHTSASLTIQENADPSVQADIGEFFARLAPENQTWYRHRTEGPDDMPAHLKSALTDTSLTIPVVGGRLGLGTWQGIYLFEHRRRPQRRAVLAHLIGD